MRLSRLIAGVVLVLVVLCCTGCPPAKHSVSITWDPGAVDAQHGPAADYVVFRSSVHGGPYVQIGQTVAPAFTDSTPIQGNNFYVVVAENSGGVSSYSDELGAFVP